MQPRRIDWAVFAAVATVAQLETWLSDGIEPKSLHALAALALALPLAWRRVAPIAVLAAVFVPLFALAIAGEEFDPAYIMLVLLVAVTATGYYAERRRAIAGFVLGLVLLGTLLAVEQLAGAGAEESSAAGDFLFLAAILGIVFALAVVVRERSVEAGELGQRAAQLEREQEEQARRAVADERARIARELHDVVAHSVSVIAVQAGSMRRRLRHEHPAEAQELSGIEATAREALGEMRRMLGLLRSDGDGVSLSPQPGIEQLERLVEQVRETGLPVELRVEGERRELPAGLDLAAYRIVQEALTNVIKHAGSAKASVLVRFGAGEVELDIRDDGPGPAPGGDGGHGLIGMRERVALYGGSLQAGADGDRGFRVHASLPLSSA